MNSIEEQLWNYIDGFCTPEEQQAITGLIASDERYSTKYKELLKLHEEFAAMEMEEPAMAFTYKVMESIRTENSLQPLKATINKRIILGIAAFFVVTIAALILFSLANINWSAGTNLGFELKMPQLLNGHIKSFFTAPVLKGFIFFDVVIGLFLLDSYLRKRSHIKQP